MTEKDLISIASGFIIASVLAVIRYGVLALRVFARVSK